MNTQNTNNDWWRGAIFYQVYPRSFQDSNGDGVGDLKGITSRLDYIASLGVDAVWISPFFKSPMDDFGYDVSDYRDVDPMFGSLADFDALLARAHALNLKVMIDLVLSHSSEQHPWFVESRTSKNNPKSDWYVWADPQADGSPPNNWLSIFGGSAWQWDPRREQYYLHNFLKSQPDLNFHNPDVQNELLDITRFWLDRGVDGFRLDTINFYFHDKELRSNPALPLNERNATIAPSVNPYNHQRHLYSKNQPENIQFLSRFRALLDEYDNRTSLGEVGDANAGLEIIGEYTTGNDKIHMCYAFEFLEASFPTAKRIADVFERFNDVAADGWACWAFSNHDVQRHTSRWSLSPEAQAALVSLQTCLRGAVCLYQGEELGLSEAEVAFEDLQDPYGIEFWPEYKGRDGCRTPMVWSQNEENGGFSKGKPWLPVSVVQLEKAVNGSESNDESLIHHYREAIALRKNSATLQKGFQSSVNVNGNVIEFTREMEGDVIYCAFNISENPQQINLPTGEWKNLNENLRGAVPAKNGSLGPWQYVIARKQ